MKSFRKAYHWVLIDLPDIPEGLFHMWLISMPRHCQCPIYICLVITFLHNHCLPSSSTWDSLLERFRPWKTFLLIAVGPNFWAVYASWKQPSTNDCQNLVDKYSGSFTSYLRWHTAYQRSLTKRSHYIHRGSLLNNKPLIGFLLYPVTISHLPMSFLRSPPKETTCTWVCFWENPPKTLCTGALSSHTPTHSAVMIRTITEHRQVPLPCAFKSASNATSPRIHLLGPVKAQKIL